MWKLLLLLIGAELVAAVAAQSVCDWSRKHDGHGDSEDEEGTFPTDTECVQHCEEKKKTKPEINGATVRKSDKMCWCEIGMNKKEADDKYDTCYLKAVETETISTGRCSHHLNEGQCRQAAPDEGIDYGLTHSWATFIPPGCVRTHWEVYFNTNASSTAPCTKGEKCICHKVSGTWAAWKAWGECSHSCGGGEQKRSRECLDSKGDVSTACDGGDAEEVQACNVDECPADTCEPTLGGNSGGSCCTFPFTYQGQTYHKCTDKGWHTFWCATTENYDTDGKWGDCDFDDSCLATEGGNTDAGHPCHFPFIYRGEQVTSCIKTRHHRLWCATTDNYDTDWKWGNCLPETTPCDHDH